MMLVRILLVCISIVLFYKITCFQGILGGGGAAHTRNLSPCPTAAALVEPAKETMLEPWSLSRARNHPGNVGSQLQLILVDFSS